MDTILSVVVLVAVLLILGAVLLWRRQGPGKQIWLMLLLATVMIVNVLIWTLPNADGTAPLDRPPPLEREP